MTDEPKPPPGPSSEQKTKTRTKTAARPPEREQSSIQFPYNDLETAIAVARAILTAGGVALTRDQLAGQMNHAVGSGTFIVKIASARLFGLVSFLGSKYELTNLGFNILDADERRQKTARAEAFLSVPLYRRAYDDFKGRQLPPRPHGLEQAFIRFGVAPKQKANARLAFDKSATQAGFFPNGPDRLIEPIIGVPSSSSDRGRQNVEANASNEAPSFERSAPTIPEGLHPFIQGLLDTLPEPQTNWAIEGRAKWLQAAANIFDLIYKGNGAIEIKARSTETGDGTA